MSECSICRKASLEGTTYSIKYGLEATENTTIRAGTLTEAETSTETTYAGTISQFVCDACVGDKIRTKKILGTLAIVAFSLGVFGIFGPLAFGGAYMIWLPLGGFALCALGVWLVSKSTPVTDSEYAGRGLVWNSARSKLQKQYPSKTEDIRKRETGIESDLSLSHTVETRVVWIGRLDF